MNIFDMPCSGKQMKTVKRHEYTLWFENREDALEQADMFVEELISTFGTFSYYHAAEVEGNCEKFVFNAIVNEVTFYDGNGKYRITNDGMWTVCYDPGVTFSFVTVTFRRCVHRKA